MKHLYIILFVLSSQLIFAQQIVTDRPDQTESSSTIQARAFQFETGFQMSYFGGGVIGVEKEFIAPGSLLRYGLTDFIEIRIAHQRYQVENFHKQNYEGIGSWELGAKFQILKKEDINTQIAFLSHLLFPNGNEGWEDEYSLVNKLALSHELSDILSLGYNVGFNLIHFERFDLSYSLALGISINDEVGIYIEPYGEWIDMEELESNFNTGITYLLNDNFQFDFSIGTGINHKMNYIGLGCSWLVQPW